MAGMTGMTGADARNDYYDKWSTFSKSEVERIEAEAETEKAAADASLGLDSDAPRSEAEEQNRAKNIALKAAKKQWDDKTESEAAMKFVLEGKVDATVEVDEAMLAGRKVLVIKDCQRCNLVLPPSLGVLIKLFVDGCAECVVTLGCSLITEHVEVGHCEGCTLALAVRCATVQADLCAGLTVQYDPRGAGEYDEKSKIFFAGVSGLKVELGGAEVASADYSTLLGGEARVADKSGQKVDAEEVQFSVSRVGGEFLVERVYRIGGGQPVTQRELDAQGERAPAIQDALRTAELAKIGGNEAYASGEHYQACAFYAQAIEAAPTGPLVAACHANRAACLLKLGQHEQALVEARSCLALEPTHVKARFRAGLALHALKKFPEAAKELSMALDREPKNEAIKTALTFAERKCAEEMRKRQDRQAS